MMLAFVRITCRDSVLDWHCLMLSHIKLKTPVMLMGVEVLFNFLMRYVTKLLIARIIKV
jgi:hypothetical protein